MEKAILKTLIYFDYFDYPLKAWEIHKWLTQKKGSLTQVEKALKKLILNKKIFEYKDYYFLKSKKVLIRKRLNKEAISKKRILKAKILSFLIKSIPWIKLAGISGSLSMLSSSKSDDIDFFIITSKNRIWLSRLLLIILTSATGLRRKRSENKLSASGKICINLILEESNLAQKKKNIYLAHEVLQMHVLWQRDGIYSRFLEENSWAFKLLPNWRSGITIQNSKFKIQNYKSKIKSFRIADLLEEIAKKLQLKIMNSPAGAERIESGALYFHPEDKGVKIMEEYKQRTESLK